MKNLPICEPIFSAGWLLMATHGTKSKWNRSDFKIELLITENIDKQVVAGFGDEWSRFDQSKLTDKELAKIYYRFDNRPAWFRTIWKSSDVIRKVVSQLPHNLRFSVSQFLAATVYFPLARTAKILEKIGGNVEKFPLSQYRNNSFYTMRTDALDRFGTSLEKRFTKNEIRHMMEECGSKNITFSETSFWTAIGVKK